MTLVLLQLQNSILLLTMSIQTILMLQKYDEMQTKRVYY